MRARVVVAALLLAACGGGDDVVGEGTCTIADPAEAPDYLQVIPCTADFEALASDPIDLSIPGARSGKVVLDRSDGDALYFQNTRRYAIHHDFAAAVLSGGDHPIVPALADFNTTEYYSPDRRFLLGAVTHYESADVWALEIAPYDTATAAQIETLYAAVADVAWFGRALVFHPTSEAVTATAAGLSQAIPIVTTDELYAGSDYQPLNLGSAVGRLHFTTAAEIATTYVSYRDLVVLDEAPNDISVVSGIITEEFQTPLSHINVLSRNRGTPNMGLRDALTDPTLRALDGKWVALEVGALDWSIREATQAEADVWWEEHRPTPVVLPAADLSVTELRDAQGLVDESGPSLRDAIKTAVNIYGGKAAHYGVLVNTPELPVRPAFAIPAYYYAQFMQQNGFVARIAALRADPSFQADPAVRDAALATLRADMEAAPVDAAFQERLRAKLASALPGQTARFRSSTNSEDLDGFPCAGCYESHTGDPAVWDDVLDAIRETWSSAFLFRTWEEREYYGVDHASIAMALLVHHNFPDEEANGVAVTANPFDASGLQPAFYVNVQRGGEAEVVHPPAGVTSDQILYYFDQPGQPVVYLSRSSLTGGAAVLTTAQLHELGEALDAIHTRFSAAYGPASGNDGWYAMDIEFKLDDGAIWIKQARPYPKGAE